MSGFPPGLEPVEDLTPAAWVVSAFGEPPERPFRVRELVPPGFERYGRIPHRFEDERGSLSESEAATLVRILQNHTSAPTACWFATWSGWGALDGASMLHMSGGSFRRRYETWRARIAERNANRRRRRELDHLPSFQLVGRGGGPYFLSRGALTDAQRFRLGDARRFQSPSLWWPDDRAWFVHTHFEATGTYVGGSSGLVVALTRDQVLGSVEVGIEDPVIW